MLHARTSSRKKEAPIFRGLTGIIELYIVGLVWNRQRFVKDPDTGKRQAGPNPPSEWIVREVPKARVLNALRHHLMDPGLFTEFCVELTREINRLRQQGRAMLDSAATSQGVSTASWTSCLT